MMSELTGITYQELSDRASELGVVAAFEGMCVDDFKSALVDLPDADLPDKNYVARLIDSHILNRQVSGVDGCVDAGEEAYFAAEMFTGPYANMIGFNVNRFDMDLYIKKYFESHREVIASEYNFENVDHDFLKIFNVLPVEAFHDLRSLSVFNQLSETIMQEIPQVAESRSLNVLYPGSGSHIAPLITALNLIDEDVVDDVNFTYTEIQDYSTRLGHLLSIGEDCGVFESVTVESDRSYLFDGREVVYDIVYKGKHIKITFALNRSGQNYFRKKDLKEADFVILHDPGSGYLSHSYSLLADILYKKEKKFPQKDQLVVMEGMPRMFTFGYPQDMSLQTLSGQYGHCNGFYGNNDIGEIRQCSYHSGLVFKLNDPALLSLVQDSKNKSQISSQLFPDGQEMQIFTDD